MVDEIKLMAGKKLEEKILPPDPARIIAKALSLPPDIEHVTILPPLIERIHKVVNELVEEKLPRLKQMAEFEKREWLEFP